MLKKETRRMSKKDDCEGKGQTAELADLAPTTADAAETKAGTHTFHAFGNTYLGGVNVAAGDLD